MFNLLPLSRVLAVSACLICMSGCVAPAEDPQKWSADLPIDFSLHLHVKGDTGQSEAEQPFDLARMRSIYILTTDRRLRVGFGPRVTFATSPDVRRIVSPAELESVWRHLRDHNLMMPPSPGLSTADRAAFDIAITARGQTTRYLASKDADGLVELVRLLGRIARFDPPTKTTPEP